MTSPTTTADVPRIGQDDPPSTAGRPCPPGEARRFRVGFAALLVGTAVLYLWNLGATGYANTFYAAAVQASTRNPVAWLFAAVDAPGLITVDKPPADNWWMALGANLFGFSPWSMLVPQALLGVGSVALLVLAVRRWSGPGVALGAGALLAVTPVAVIMFRFDDPDPMLTFLLVAAAYAFVRAVDAAPRRPGTAWLVACGALVGLGFLAKMGVALFVVPAFGLVFLVAADVSWWRRCGQLAAGLVGLVVGAGWFLGLVALWPASARPWIGGSTDNSLWQLAVGYNGVARILGRTSSVAATVSGTAAPTGHGGPPGGGFGGTPGFGRLFTTQFAGQIAWLLPAALIALVALLWVTRRAPRTDTLRAAALLWGTWLVVATVVLSLMQGMVHTYYTVVMAPPLAALVALGAREAWRDRDTTAARTTLAATIALTAIWSTVILSWTPTFAPWLRWLVLAVGLATALLVALGSTRGRRGLAITAVVGAVVAAVGGPTAYALDTVASPHAGTQAAAGPATPRARWTGAVRGGGHSPGARPSGGFGRGQAPDPALDALLARAGTTWSAAVPSTMSAAGLELSSDTSVMGLGGFSGSDPTPTLTQFQGDVADGKVRYFVPGTRSRWRGGDATTTAITGWVESHDTALTVGGQTVYDLAAPAHR